MWCVAALRGHREPGLRYLLAIVIRCRVIVDLGSICAVSGRGYAYQNSHVSATSCVLSTVFDDHQNNLTFSFHGPLTRVCFRNATASRGEDLLLVSLWLQGSYPGSRGAGACLYCTGVNLIEERGQSPPPPPPDFVFCFFFALKSRPAIGTVYSLCTWPVIPRNLSLFYVHWW